MSESPGITSLKSHPLDDTPSIGGNQDQSTQRISLSQEITILERRKRDLLVSIEALDTDYQKSREKIAKDTDLPRLLKRKRILLEQINSLVKSFKILQSNKDNVLAAFQKFGQERVAELNAIAQSLDLELSKESKTLTAKSQSLVQWEQFLDEFGEYFAQLAEIVEAVSLSQGLERAKMDKRLSIIGKMESNAKSAEDRAIKVLNDAESKMVNADSRYQDADKLAKFFEEEADKEKELLKNAQKDIKLKEESVKAREEFLDRKEKALDIRDKKLKDERQTLQRVADELAKKGAKI